MNPNGRTIQIRKAPIVQLLKESIVTKDTISLGQGIPFFPPPRQAIDAMKHVLDTGEADTYSHDQGLFILRQVISTKLKNENNIRITTNHIIVTTGTNQGFFNVILAITNPCDEIILISPTYFNYIMAVKLVDCVPVIVSSDDGTFLPDIEKIKANITKKTRAIVTISPNNPTGVVYPSSLLKEINQLCADHHIYHISDEVYEYFIYDDNTHISPATFDPMTEHTITLFSCSKSFGMAGYRVGYIISPLHLIDDLMKVQDTLTICAPVLGQYAASKAIRLGSSYLRVFIPEIERIRTSFYKSLSRVDTIEVNLPQGSLYFFIKIKNKEIDARIIAKKLIDRFNVITIPGPIFDVSFPSLRVSFGNLRYSESIIGLDRLMDGLTVLLG